MRILIIGDVGASDGVRHVGDEAMLDALIEQLRRRGDFDFVIVSANPDETRALYGVEAIERPTSESNKLAGGLARVEAIVSAATGTSGELAHDDSAWSLIHAVADSDGVIIAGGGNLSSLWPNLVFDRLAVSRLAQLFSKPLVVSGQTIGPTLTEPDGVVISEILREAKLVGVREQNSYDLVVEGFGIAPEKVWRTVDDAAFLRAPAEEELERWLPARAYCLSTFAPYAGIVQLSDLVEAAARLVNWVATRFDLDVVFLPHHGDGDDPTGGDGLVHELVAKELQVEHVLLPTLSNRVSAELARRASFVVSSRYHPAVFAVSAGVPAATISVDEYTDVKTFGALDNFGLGALAFPVSSVLLGDAVAVLEGLPEIDGIKRSVAELSSERAAHSMAWWDAVVASLEQSAPAVDAAAFVSREPVFTPSSTLDDRVATMRQWQLAASRLFIANLLARRDLETEAADSRDHIASVEQTSETIVGQASAERDEALRELAGRDVALQASYDRLGQMEDVLAKQFDAVASELQTKVDAVQSDAVAARDRASELESKLHELNGQFHRLSNSKLMRWSRLPRSVYGVVRRR